MKPLSEVLKSKKNGLYYGNRVLLPFVVDILKAVIENDIITDFSKMNKGSHYVKTKEFTEIYFYDYKNLSDVITEFETIKLVVVEDGKDIFNFKNHRMIALHLHEKHKIEIDEITENKDDILFIE